MDFKGRGGVYGRVGTWSMVWAGARLRWCVGAGVQKGGRQGLGYGLGISCGFSDLISCGFAISHFERIKKSISGFHLYTYNIRLHATQEQSCTPDAHAHNVTTAGEGVAPGPF